MEAVYRMKWPKRYTDSGFVREILGFDTKAKRMKLTEHIEPDVGKHEACTLGYGDFTFKEGKWFWVRNTFETKMRYLFVQNGEVIEKTREEMIEFFKKEKKKVKTNPYSQEVLDEGDNLSSEVDFLIQAFDEALQNLQESGAERTRGKYDTIKMFARSFNIYDTYEIILKHFKEGKSKDEIRKLLSKSKKHKNHVHAQPANDLLNELSEEVMAI